MNLDAFPDIVSAADNTGLKVWLGDGGTSWTPATTPVSVGVFLSIAVGDINNDGMADIVAGKNGGLNAWVKNRTTGNWEAADTGLPGTRQFKSVALTDMNRDGTLDIVSASTAGGSSKGVVVYRGNGKGSWTAADTGMPTTGTYSNVAATDFNKDGNADIVASGNIGVDAWIGDGKGNWTLRDSGLPGMGTYSGVAFGDFDLDGCQDIVAVSEQGAGIRVWSGDGTGIWTMRLGLPTTGDYTGVAVADVNLDAYPDILASSLTNNQTIWAGDGNFNWHLQTGGMSSDPYQKKVSLADFDRDGRIDYFGPGATGGISIWRSSADRTVNTWLEVAAPAVGFQVADIAVADLNLDGKSDVCYATRTGGLRLFTGDGASTWSLFTSPVSTGTFNSVRICDFNRDGKPDIVAISTAGIFAWSGNAAGTWTTKTSGLPSTGAWFSLAVDDYNDDGKADIIAGSGQSSGMRVYSGDGTGVWTLKLGLPLTGAYHDAAPADVNNDGDVDLVVASGADVRCYLGNGAFNWTLASSGLPAGAAFRNVEVGDVDRDGRIDIFAAASNSEGVRVFAGDGAGVWSASGQPSQNASRGLSIGDADIDGVLDIALGSNGSAKGIACELRRAADWDHLSSGLPAAGDFEAVTLADINIDGRLDILSTNGTNTGARIWAGGYAAPPAPWFNLTVVDGWNLISVPLMSTVESLPAVLTDKADGGAGLVQWDRVIYRNPASPSDPWKQYNSAWNAALNDLSHVQSHMGVWIHVTVAGDGAICLGGDGYEDCSGTAVPIKAGWNLVGYPSSAGGGTIADLKAQCPSVDAVETFDGAQTYRLWSPPDSYVMRRGEGYWVHASADTIWLVP